MDISEEELINLSVLFRIEEENMENWLKELGESPKLMVDWHAYIKQPSLNEFSAQYSSKEHSRKELMSLFQGK